MRERRGRRLLVIAGGWLVAVALAVLVGVVGINLVGSGLTGERPAPMTEDQVARELRNLTAAPVAPPGSSAPVGPPGSSAPIGPPGSSAPVGPPESAAPSTTPPAGGTSFTTQGGLVVADCSRILSMAPAQGWSVAEKDDDEGEFRSAGDPSVVLEVDLECVGGQPQVRVTPGD